MIFGYEYTTQDFGLQLSLKFNGYNRIRTKNSGSWSDWEEWRKITFDSI